jgi:maltose O-acetyltransferase
MNTLSHRLARKLERTLLPKLIPVLDHWTKLIRDYRQGEIKQQLKDCAPGVRFKQDVNISHPQNISLGKKVYIGPNVTLDGRGGITIGDNTTLGSNVVILSANHDYQSDALPYAHNVYIHKPVTIGQNVWIAANVLIVPGISIGDGAIIAAGTVVSANVEPLAIVGNQPIRVIKYRDRAHYDRLATPNLVLGESLPSDLGDARVLS